ncbi:hypothetical protein [Streptomyces sp. KS 21]|uniref:hypothetical protein n=1 Tax=Streptomyces sp. KS 21 TaxID=2485150 RepID=UPI0010639C21|nr:hypothetical protein [Streptomyces sp. KS 21]TDU77600.1 hypothetical protein EDD91_4359 [Streptomyces sp. KS 21]
MTDRPGGSRTDAQASGHGRVFQAGRDQHVTEQHFHVRRSRAAVVAAVVATAVAVAAAAVVAVLVGGDPGGTGSSPASDPAASGAVQSPAPQISPPAVRDAQPVRSEGVRLTYVDLDAGAPKVLMNNVGASFYVNYDTGDRPEHKIYGASGIARWKGEAEPTLRRCAELIDTQGAGDLPVVTGARYCVRSSGGRIAAITVGAFDTATSAFKGDVVVWGAGPSSP